MLAETLTKLKHRARCMVVKQFNLDNGWVDGQRGVLPIVTRHSMKHCMSKWGSSCYDASARKDTHKGGECVCIITV